jgi:hypothetical protein
MVVLYCYKCKTEELTSQKQEDDHQWHQRAARIEGARVSEPYNVAANQETGEYKEKPR